VRRARTLGAERSARQLAYHALQRIDHDGAYANLVVPRLLDRSGLPDRDRAFVTHLVYGATRMRRACDFAVDRFVVKEPSPELRSLLRLGAFQLLFGGVAPHAAVNDTVALAPQRSKAFVNAVLRKVAATPVTWPDDATRLSYPDWIVDRLVTELGRDEAMASLEHMNRPAPVNVREDGYVQDLSSRWVADLVGAEPGDRVADLCAAPGGKTTRLARTARHVVALDILGQRARLVQRNADQLGLDDVVTVAVADATAPPLRAGAFDRVLVDAPCSGLGALRRRPDARWRVEPEDVDHLSALQRAIVDAATRLVRPGGVLVYSVCTLTASESIAHDTLAWEPLPAPGPPWRPYGRGARLLPHDADTDGMVALRWRRSDPVGCPA
jgi:16S rRNA (cytosine967-C5)-methyltransferase